MTLYLLDLLTFILGGLTYLYTYWTYLPLYLLDLLTEVSVGCCGASEGTTSSRSLPKAFLALRVPVRAEDHLGPGWVASGTGDVGSSASSAAEAEWEAAVELRGGRGWLAASRSTSSSLKRCARPAR